MPGTPFSLAVRQQSDTTVFELSGDVNRTAQEPLDEAYGHLDGTTRRVLLNFTATDYINSTGIAVIVGILAKARTGGRQVAACGLSDHYREIFSITRLSDFMTIHDDDQAALAAG
jgi:anti-anti-sigma factor